ncbi:MAG: hypothetical protein JXA77_09750 [Bacteroidales bacterium]|nr:hypothetical protein [Bacteroidales bacterium]MBN2821428.1 hypothetical protein [Bacteroidales bacterium]
MERKTVYEDENLRLEFVEKGRYLHETWWGRTPGETFKKLLDIIVKELKTNNANGLLLDAREHKGLGPDSQKLAAETIGNYAKAHGSLKEAIIVPKDVFSQFSVENYSKKIKETENPVTTQFFDSVEKAENWLQE